MMQYKIYSKLENKKTAPILGFFNLKDDIDPWRVFFQCYKIYTENMKVFELHDPGIIELDDQRYAWYKMLYESYCPHIKPIDDYVQFFYDNPLKTQGDILHFTDEMFNDFKESFNRRRSIYRKELAITKIKNIRKDVKNKRGLMTTKITFNKKGKEVKREKIDCEDSGIKATGNLFGETFFFYTVDQNLVENAMNLMGYGSRDFNLSFFKNRKQPTDMELTNGK